MNRLMRFMLCKLLQMIHDRLCAKNKRVFFKIHVFWPRIYFQIHQINKYTYLYHKTMRGGDPKGHLSHKWGIA